MNKEDLMCFWKEKKQEERKERFMNHNLDNLNDILFEELERLNNSETFKDDDIFIKELNRSKSITTLATAIVNNARILLDAKKYVDVNKKDLPKLIGISVNSDK